jgi:16S rRNA (adenine1518-N6/adenine1519-N6)-dimethyltransferase
VVKLAFKNPEGIEGITSEHRLLVRTAFNQRRKTLRNSLTQLIADNESRESVFERAGINPSARAEELSPDDYIRFAKIYAAYAADSR